jgi:hypothetical protein
MRALTDRNVSIRIGVTGKEDVKRAFDEVGKAGQDAFNRTASAMDTAGTAADRQTQRLQRLAQAAKQAASADEAQRKFNAFMGIGAPVAGSARESAKVFEEAAKATENLEARTKALRAQIDPLGAAQARLNAEIAEANALFKAGTISAREQAAAHQLAQNRFNATARALRSVGDGSRLASYQVVNLGYQLNDVVIGLASGQRPLTVLIQQGSQIAQVFAGSGMGVGGVLKELGRIILRLVSPTTLLVAGLAAVGGTALYAYNSYITAQKELQVATAGVGRAAGATVDQLNRIADAASSAGRISVSAARDMEVAFLRTGRIGVDQFGDLIAAARNYAATTGQDIEAATKELADAFADPAKGVDLLNAKVGGFDDRTRQLIKTLSSQNELTAAQRLLFDNLRPSLVDATEATTALGRAWDFVARNASNAVDAIGRAIDRATDPTLQQQLEDLMQERARVTGPWGARYLFERPLSRIDADIANVRRQLDELQRRADQARLEALAARTSVLAGDVARNVTPGFNDLQTLRQQQALLAGALNDPLARQKVADLEQVAAAYDAVTRAVQTWLAPAEKARRLDELEIRALEAKTPAQRAAIAEERRRIELSGQVVTTATAEAEITRAGEKARAEAIRTIREQSLALSVNARASLDVANAYLRNAAAAQEAEARRKALTEAIRTGVDVETRMREILRDEIAQTAAQSAKSVADIAAQAAAQRRLNEAVASGAMTLEQARRQMQVEQALRPLLVAQSLAEGDAKATLTRVIDALRAAYGALNAEEARNAALGQIETQKDQIALLQKQIALAGTNESLAAIEIAQLQAKQQLTRQGIDLSSQEAQAIIANAAAIERLNQSLSLARSSTQELIGLTDRTFSHFADLIAQGKTDWKSWADAGRAAILDINRELVKLALLNPLKNLLFGTNLPTMSSVGGLIGSLLKGLKFHEGGVAGIDGRPILLPAAVFRDAPRLHDGAFLSPDEIPAILQRGERVLNRKEAQSYNARGSAMPPVINVTIQTPNPSAFQASRTQLAADLSRAVQIGMRGR